MRRVLPSLLLGSLLMLLEALWLGAWLRWLAALAGDLKPAGLLTLLALGLGAYGLSRLLLATRIDLRLARRLAAGEDVVVPEPSLRGTARTVKPRRPARPVWSPPDGPSTRARPGRC